MTPQDQLRHDVRNLAMKIKIRLRHRVREYDDVALFEEVDRVLDMAIVAISVDDRLREIRDAMREAIRNVGA